MVTETITSGDFQVEINQIPIKAQGQPSANPALLRQQAEVVASAIVDVDSTETHGTCSDERFRLQLRNGRHTVPSPAVFGGPNMYGLAIAELTGYFPDSDESSGLERLAAVTDRLVAADVLSGGHDGCAANDGFGQWIKTIADSPEAMLAYAQSELGEKFDADLAGEVVSYARAVVASGRYATWTEAGLTEILGAEADEVIEKLGDVPHEGLTAARVKVPGKTIDPNLAYENSVLGKGAFDFDDWYADSIERALASGAPDTKRRKLLSEHARELIIAAVAGAVPNEELYQLNISATE